MILAALSLFGTAVALPAQGNQAIGVAEIVDALMQQDWSRVEAYKRQLGSFKHPIHPQDARDRGGDVLSGLARYGSAADRYGRALVAMRIAMENGADPNEGGGWPLMYITGADEWGKMVDRLLKAGADPNKPQGIPLVWAVKSGRLGNARLLLQAGANPNTSVADAPYRRPSPTVRKSVGGDSPGRYPTGFEKTAPLTFAARLGNAPMAELLIGHKAAVGARHPQTGRTALHEAAETDHPAVVKVLLKAGASRAVKDRAGRTPLAAARRFGAKAAIRALGG